MENQRLMRSCMDFGASFHLYTLEVQVQLKRRRGYPVQPRAPNIALCAGFVPWPFVFRLSAGVARKQGVTGVAPASYLTPVKNGFRV